MHVLPSSLHGLVLAIYIQKAGIEKFPLNSRFLSPICLSVA